jgi:DNA-binding LacI/PurR family transcriptional regulator
MPSTLKDVAIHAKVSIATVSRVLNGSGYVSNEVKERVEKIMKELNYQPNAIARSLKNAKTHTIGVIVPDVSNPYFMGIVRAFEDKVSPNYHLLLCSSDEIVEKEISYLDVFLEKRVDGLFLSHCRLEVADSLNKYLNQNIPVVLVDRHAEDLEVDTVYEENIKSSYQLTNHLISIGHRDIAMINSSIGSNSKDRQRGYEQALKDAGFESSPEYVLCGKFNQQTGYTFGKQLLMMGKKRPTAIFAANNLIAVGVLQAIREFGLEVPNDISLVSFGDLLFPELISPTMTTVIQHPERVGIVAAELLLARMSGDLTNSNMQKIVIPTSLRLGQSTKIYKQNDA